MSVKIGPENTQSDLLQSLVDIQIPEQISTVGEALSHILRPFGFQLDGSPEVDEQYLLLSLALPEPHRRLGPMTLMDALITLDGKTFQPVINPVKRTIHYQLYEGFGKFVTDEDVQIAKQQWLEQKEIILLSTEEQASIAEVKKEHQHYGPVQQGDSLSRIASQINLKGLAMGQALGYLFNENPHAFVNHNMNHLLKGVGLNIPPVEKADLPTVFESNQVVDEHYRLWVQREVTP